MKGIFLKFLLMLLLLNTGCTTTMKNKNLESDFIRVDNFADEFHKKLFSGKSIADDLDNFSDEDRVRFTQSMDTLCNNYISLERKDGEVLSVVTNGVEKLEAVMLYDLKCQDTTYAIEVRVVGNNLKLKLKKYFLLSK